jgi:hypothetical protein
MTSITFTVELTDKEAFAISRAIVTFQDDYDFISPTMRQAHQKILAALKTGQQQ